MKIHSLDYFPGCYDPVGVYPHGDHTQFPIPGVPDFDTIMEWTRRVQSWRFRCTIGLSVVRDVDVDLFSLNPPDPDTGLPGGPINEAGRICSIGWFGTFHFGEGDTSDLLSVGISVHPIQFGDFVWTHPTCFRLGNEFLMACRITINGSGTSMTSNADTFTVPSNSHTGETVGSFCGKDVSFLTSSLTLPMCSDIIIDPATYFEYADDDGSNPVWNPLSGALVGDVTRLPPLNSVSV